jgi:tetratricopeptide (TPR) repeat protein
VTVEFVGFGDMKKLFLILLAAAAVSYADLESYVADIEADIAADPGNPDLYVELAEVYAGAGMYDDAAAAYREAIARTEEDAFVTLALADMYLESGLEGNREHLSSAVDTYRTALSKDDTLIAARKNMGRAYHEMGQYENAVGAYELYLEEKQLDYDILWLCGRAYEGLGRYEQALEKYQIIYDAVTGPFATAGRVGGFGTADDLKRHMDNVEKEHLR